MVINNRIELLANSWSCAANNGYNDLLVPRFAPWTNDVLRAVADEINKSHNNISDNPPRKGCCCVPCCGPGQELIPLSQLLGNLDEEWTVLGIDLAPGMIDIAKQRIVKYNNDQKNKNNPNNQSTINVGDSGNKIDAIIGDCSKRLPLPLPGGVAVNNNNGGKNDGHCYYNLIVSIFGFQQMLDPFSVLQNWLDSLCSQNGVLILCFWPSAIEDFDDNDHDSIIEPRPFTKFKEIVQKRQHAIDQNNNKEATTSAVGSAEKKNIKTKEKLYQNNNNNNNQQQQQPLSLSLSWDDEVIQKIKIELDGKIDIIKDQYITHEIQWDNIDQFWNAMTNAGPWHALKLKKGNEFVDSLKHDVCSVFDNSSNNIIRHKAKARLLILRHSKKI